jgi:hypothetical protein
VIEPTVPEEQTDYESKRYEWRPSTTEALLNILVDKKRESPDSFSLNLKTWPVVSKELAKTVSHHPSSTQCREKFYSLKRSYRKFLNDSKKTYAFESEMSAVLDGDPSIMPPMLRSSLGLSTSDHDTLSDDTDEESTSSVQGPLPKPRKRKMDEMREYFEEQDKKNLRTDGCNAEYKQRNVEQTD